MTEDTKLIEEIKTNYSAIVARARQAALNANRIPSDVTVVAVSKTHPAGVVAAGVEAGITDFGENYVQEFKEKHEELTRNGISIPRWHFIGHLQTNKVKYIAPFVDIIHSVDSLHLAEEISRQAEKYSRTIDIMLQVNTSKEDSKSGCEPEEIFELFEQTNSVSRINIVGLMTIGSFSEDEKIYRNEFRTLARLRNELRDRFGSELRNLSMGMSGDFETAIEEGATMVRVGTAIFGSRFYNK